MEFRIADSFTDSLGRLTSDEQKVTKTTAFDLQMNPANPGHQFHKLDHARDKNFWSVRVSRDIRLIVHKTATSLLLCYVDHHDKAYDWAERRKLEVHPMTGAAQFVEIRERVEHIVIPQYANAQVKPHLFANIAAETLLGYGVPEEWLADVKQATEDSVLDLATHLPQEAAEALLELATGGKPRPPKPLLVEEKFSTFQDVEADYSAVAPMAIPANAFEHPDAQRRFRVMTNIEDLRSALDAPWDKWTIFLHPSQREWVEREFNGPSRVSGSAGTGKTIVALHRTVFLARKYPDSRVLLTTFSDALASALHTRLRRLIVNEPRLGERIDVLSMDAVGARLYGMHIGKLRLASLDVIRAAFVAADGGGAIKFTPAFLLQEWRDVVDAWGLKTWEEYRTVPRLGRKTRLSEAQRQALWTIFEKVNRQLADADGLTSAGMFGQLAERMQTLKQPPYDFIVVDESQDLSISQVRFLAALGSTTPNRLFFAGDLGQRIFQVPFSWSSQGVDIRGRSGTLRVNYRTSHQIRSQADGLLSQQLIDVDGNVEDRRGTVSLFNGPAPDIRNLPDENAEIEDVAVWLTQRIREGLVPHEIGIMVRTPDQVSRAKAAAARANLSVQVVDEKDQPKTGTASILTMHLAKGLEFRAVAIMACDDEVLPLQSRIESVADESDLEEVYNTERHLLYVACTRARDHLLVTAAAPGSEFLEDLKS
ncbi:MAG TPA: 3'-5' exonuclease [Burkholderiales bacterium]|nr:3'-5' exonuclease [Burkholderiales bacterium]